MVAYNGRTYGALIPVTINILPNGRAYSTLKMKRGSKSGEKEKRTLREINVLFI